MVNKTICTLTVLYVADPSSAIDNSGNSNYTLGHSTDSHLLLTKDTCYVFQLQAALAREIPSVEDLFNGSASVGTFDYILAHNVVL